MRRGIVLLLVLAACGGSAAGGATDGVTPTSAAARPSSRYASPPASSTVTVVPNPTVTSTTAVTPEPTSNATTAATTITPAAGGERPARLAVIGCSQTRDAIQGYNQVRDDLRFGSDQDAQYLSGASIEVWAQPRNRKWDTFATLAGPDVAGLLVQICYHAQRSVGADVAMVQDVIERAIDLIGREVPVYIMGLNDWDPRSLCPRGDYPASAELADEVAAAGPAVRVPDLGPLDPTETDDGCHGNRAGDRLMGEQLAAFFDG